MVFACLAFQACAQEDYLGAGSSGSTMGSSGDYISPNMGQMSRSSNPDEGLAGMLQWLDTPVPNFPWYTAGGSFYSQPYSDITFSPYREYYTTTGTPVVGGIVSNPAKFDITAENAFQCVLRCRCGIAILPVCVHGAIQDQRPLDPGSNKLDTICGKPGRHLAAAGRQFARWRACGLLRDNSDRYNQFEVQHLSVQLGL